MNNKTTIALAICVFGIFAIIGIGFLTSRQDEPAKEASPVKTEPRKITLTRSQLDAKLLTESPAIITTLTATFPTLDQKYSIERAKLYDDGRWYGAILQYNGTDVVNRDTLRIVLQKKGDTWVVRTPQPKLLVSSLDITDAPKSMLNDINTPAPLAGTPTSPAIIPGE